MKKLLTYFVLLVAVGLQVNCGNPELPRIDRIYHMAKDDVWDFIAVGPGNNRLYVSHGSMVNILDLHTGDSVGIIPNTLGVHGIGFAPDQKKGYTTNGISNDLTVFDLVTNKVLKRVRTGNGPDVIIYEPFSKKVWTFNGDSSISVVDPESDSVVNSIRLEGRPEGAVSDETGKIYINIEDKNEIAVFSIAENKVIAHWPIAPGEAGTGLAIDLATKRLFTGCENQLLVVMDATNGKVIANFPIGFGCDGVVFDKVTKKIYTSNSIGTMSVVKQLSADKYELLGDVTTKRGAKTIALDQETHTLYLPTVEAIILPGKKTQAVPESFQVLVIR